jgi:Phosphorylase superfamily
MTNPSPPRHRRDFQIPIICALPLEANSVEALFDKCWEDDGQRYGKASGDPNAYTTGLIGSHNVVLAHMPSMGKASAASVASKLQTSFEGIKLALVVGICGGVPTRTDNEDILLGDVIISEGLIEYNFGRQLPNKFIRKNILQDTLGRPNFEIRSVLAKLKTYRSRIRLEEDMLSYLSGVQQKLGFEKIGYPGMEADKLFEPTYRHKHHDLSTCSVCMKCENKDDEVCQIALE